MSKAVEGLEHCIPVDVVGCKDCPYKGTGDGCINQLEKDALEHIKALEAKIKSYEDLLLKIKRDVHDKATYPWNSRIEPYVSLKVVDVLINNTIRELHK